MESNNNDNTNIKKKSQIFCKDICLNIVYDLINNVTDKITLEDSSKNIIEYYKIDKIIFKKLEYHGYINEFIKNIKNYYYPNKYFYVEREMTYNNFLTIIRQICRINNNNFKKVIVYEKDTYIIEYYIFIKYN